MSKLVITIDGPAASGKSTAAVNLAERLGATFLDTGAMYRAATFAAMEAGADMNDQQELFDVLKQSDFKFLADKKGLVVLLNGVDVTEKIREPVVTENVRYIASAARIRAELVDMQREFAAEHEKIVTEGRDQGTVVFGDADVKFFLLADSAERARRRQRQLQLKGINADFDQIHEAIVQRDQSDENRSVGPLKTAEDAVVVDTVDMSIEDVVEKLLGFGFLSRIFRLRLIYLGHFFSLQFKMKLIFSV